MGVPGGRTEGVQVGEELRGMRGTDQTALEHANSQRLLLLLLVVFKKL